MSDNKAYTSYKIAAELKREFGAEAKSVKVKLEHEKVVGEFVKKIEAAHCRAKDSKLVFGA